ncbi:MAG: N-acetyltransferase [Anaerolineae bacterium]
MSDEDDLMLQTYHDYPAHRQAHPHPEAGPPTIRPAAPHEVEAILELFAGEVRAGKMLPRDPAEMRASIGNWLVAVDRGRIVGCVSLVFFNAELCEVRSLAVHPDARGGGLGSRLIRASLDLAKQRGARRALTLTRAVRLFELAGFRRDLVANYPEKVWRDCAPCPLKEMCDEVALIYDLDPDTADGKGVTA